MAVIIDGGSASAEDKATKVVGATADNLASLTADGDLADSGAAAANVPTADEAAWVTAGKTAVPDAADLVDVNDLGSAAYAATGDFDAAGSAAAISTNRIYAKDYVTPSGSDDTAALLTLFAALSDGDTLIFESGKTYIHDISSSANRLTCPSYFEIIGNGATIHLINDPQNSNPDICSLYIPDNSKNVDIHHLRFTGENYPFAEISNKQSAAIYCPATTGSVKNINIYRNTFANLYGFPIHAAGDAGIACNITNNYMEYCANGLNWNLPGIQSDNILYHVEGIEQGGRWGVVISDNYLINCGSTINNAVYCIAVGGATSGNPSRNIIVTNNVIIDPVGGGGAIGGGDSLNSFVISDNVIIRPKKLGIGVVYSGYVAITMGQITGNIIRSIDNDGATGLGIYLSQVDGVVIDNNIVYQDSAEATTYFGDCSIATSTNITIGAGNRFTGGTARNLRFSGTCTGIRIAACKLGASSLPLDIGASVSLEVLGFVQEQTFGNSGGTLLVYNRIARCLHSTSAIAVTLPVLSAVPKYTTYIIRDANRVAGTYNITVTAGAGDTINGAATYVINSNGGYVVLQKESATTTWYRVG